MKKDEPDCEVTIDVLEEKAVQLVEVRIDKYDRSTNGQRLPPRMTQFHRMNTKELQSQLLSCEDQEYKVTVVMNAKELRGICKDLSNSSDEVVMISVYQNCVVFASKSVYGGQESSIVVWKSRGQPSALDTKEEAAGEQAESSAKDVRPCITVSMEASPAPAALPVTGKHERDEEPQEENYGELLVETSYTMKYLQDFIKSRPDLNPKVTLQVRFLPCTLRSLPTFAAAGPL